MVKKTNVAILGAAGRDYHNFLVKYKDDPTYDVKFFTAAQIPGIEKRKFPKELAGKLYRQDIPIFAEEKLTELIKKYKIDECVFSYSDLSHNEVMHRASIVTSAGASFVLLGVKETMIKSKKKIISVCAVRTGSGKSQTTRKIAETLLAAGKRVVAVRHPMPYGDLRKQEVQRFANYEDFEKHKCTIEEREEYEPWIKMGSVIYAGVDYTKILKEAEKEADILLWDGGNNDTPFYFPDLHIVVLDPHRAGHEILYHPGEVNLRMADVLVVNKIDTASKDDIETVLKNAKELNPSATIIMAESELFSDNRILMKNKKVLVVEDGPTLTHGGMKFGAGFIYAKNNGAEIIDPRKYAVGSIKETYKKYSHLSDILPAMGYGTKQIKELEETINKSDCDLVVDGSPFDISKLLKLNKPIVNVEYRLKEKGKGLKEVLRARKFIK